MKLLVIGKDKTMKKYRLISLLAAGFCLLGSSAASEVPSVTYNYSGNKAFVSGSIAEAKSIVIQLLKPGYTYDDLFKDMNNVSMVFHRDQIDTENGEFVFEIEYDDTAESGVYNAKLAGDFEEPVNFSLVLVTDKDYSEMTKKLNEYAAADAYESFEKLAEAESLKLGFDLSLYNKIPGEKKLEDFLAYVKEKPLPTDNYVQNVKAYNTFVLMKATEKNVVTNINGYIENTLIADKGIYGDYKALVTEDAEQIYLTSKLRGSKAGTVDEFEKNIIKAFILEEVRYASGYEGMMEAFGKYGLYAGVDENASSKVYKALSGNDYASCSELEGAFEEYEKQYSSSSSSKGSSSGGSSSGGFSSANAGMQYMLNGEEETAQTQKPHIISKSFEDIDGVSWASEAIIALADKGIVSGKADKIFKPNDNITREEFVKILVEAMGLAQNECPANIFADVNEADWFCRYVNIANENKIAKGTGNGKFGIGENITREDMCVMLYNALKMKNAEITAKELTFEDETEISEYAKEAVKALYGMGAVNGVSETAFEPKGNATRAQAAKVVYGVLEFLS